MMRTILVRPQRPSSMRGVAALGAALGAVLLAAMPAAAQAPVRGAAPKQQAEEVEQSRPPEPDLRPEGLRGPCGSGPCRSAGGEPDIDRRIRNVKRDVADRRRERELERRRRGPPDEPAYDP